MRATEPTRAAIVSASPGCGRPRHPDARPSAGGRARGHARRRRSSRTCFRSAPRGSRPTRSARDCRARAPGRRSGARSNGRSTGACARDGTSSTRRARRLGLAGAGRGFTAASAPSLCLVASLPAARVPARVAARQFTSSDRCSGSRRPRRSRRLAGRRAAGGGRARRPRTTRLSGCSGPRSRACAVPTVRVLAVTGPAPRSRADQRRTSTRGSSTGCHIRRRCAMRRW